MISADHRTCEPPVLQTPGMRPSSCLALLILHRHPQARAHPARRRFKGRHVSLSPTLTAALLILGSGKTSFLRLFLDTSEISPLATKDQLASVAKFVQGSSSHTSYIKSASLDIDLSLDGGPRQRLGLTLIDTPSLDFRDEPSAERLVLEVLRHIDQRFLDGIEDVSARPPSSSALPAYSSPLPGTKGSVRRPLRPLVCVALLPPYIVHISPCCPGASISWIPTKSSLHQYPEPQRRLFRDPVRTVSPNLNKSPSFSIRPLQQILC